MIINPLLSRCARGLVFALLLVIFVPSAVRADSVSSPVSVVVGGKPVSFVVSPYVGVNGDTYCPVDVVRLMGGSYAPDSDGKTVTVTTAAGARVSVPFEFVQSRFCVDMQTLAPQIGATPIWDAGSRTLTLRARLQLVREDSGGLTVTTTYPVYYHVNKLDRVDPGDPARRIYVDLFGVDLAAAPASIPSAQPVVTSIRTGHMGADTVRVVIDLRRPLDFKVDSPVQTSQIHVAVADLGARPAAPVVAARSPAAIPAAAVIPAVAAPVAAPIAPVSPPVAATTAAAAPVPQTGIAPLPVIVTPAQPGGPPQITDISYKVISPTLTEVNITVSAATRYRWMTLPSDTARLAFDLAGASLGESLAAKTAVNSPVVKVLRPGIVSTANGSFGRVEIDLARAVDFSVTTAPSTDPAASGGIVYTISLQAPAEVAVTSHGLSGKVIMVDPGHGADDTGAVSPLGYREKDFTLQIGKRLRDVLARNGATVYMTREDDVKPSVEARPRMAIAVGADYFISIHCDDGGTRNSHEGTTVYFHGSNPLTRRMAIDIVNRVAAVSGLGAEGVKSDFNRFPGIGFGVLRGSPMPAVLVECGFMNNDADVAKLKTPDVQQHIAEGITAGLLDFVAERAAQK
ncbi:MAG: N-acetylmuramoyl-L-alanine amidase [Capsulimonadaceae bacterium]